MSWKIRAQADDFFNAYQVLQEHTENVSLTTLGPAVVNLAFAVELYIKELHHVLNKKPPRGKDGHNILKLFEGLPPDVRQQIFAHDSFSQHPFVTHANIFSAGKLSAYEGFISQIDAISDAFEKWRYSYESTTLHYESSFALAFIEAVKSTTNNTRAQSAA
jgi:hypothetical protein